MHIRIPDDLPVAARPQLPHPPRRDELDVALDRVVDEPRIAVALRHAEHLRLAAALHPDPTEATRRLAAHVRDGDDVTALAALHALGAVRGSPADELLLEIVVDGEEPFAGHAAWNLGARRSSPHAIAALRRLAEGTGFTGMLAERTLTEWTALGGAPPWPETGSLPSPPAGRRPWLEGMTNAGGIVVVQPHLQSYIDADGSALGSGDAGGIAALLRSLGNSLASADGIDAVLTVTRRPDGADASEVLAAGHRVERIDIGAGAPSSWRALWRYRRRIEAELTAVGEALRGRRVVWHLRMADVGTLAAASTARRLGQRMVFTAAPDPHVVLDALQQTGRLTRRTFATEDDAHQYWFRARMVERLSAQADRLVLLPRPTLHDELVELVGIQPDDLASRAVEVPEGVDLDVLVRARHRGGEAPTPRAVAAVLDALPRHRRALPWLLTVGRLHPTKGPHRIVEAVCSGDAALTKLVNIVIVGGDLASPSADEQSTLELIRRLGVDAEPGVVTLTGHLPPADVADLAAHAARHDGVYVCASDKEEFGLAIVEALGAGLAVVAPERGGPGTYVDDGVTGVLCDTLRPEALRRAIEVTMRLAHDANRADAARAMVRSVLGVDTMARRLAAVYADCA